MLKPRISANPIQSGFTLIELIVGIVVLAIALLVVSAGLGPLYTKSTEPWHQVRAAELGHSFLNEVMARSFDENSDRSGSLYRCDATTEITPAVLCTDTAAFGPDGAEVRTGFDDVDDFHNFSASGDQITNILGLPLTGLYNGFQVQITVAYDGNFNNLANEAVAGERLAKRISIIVTTPGAEQFRFAAYRSNW